MLIDKGYNKNDVVTIKLLTGEEIVGYYDGRDNDGEVLLRKPVTPVPTQQGQIALAPFLMTSDYMDKGEPLAIRGSATVTMTKTAKAFADAYTQQVSGLDMSASSKPGLITA